MNDFWEQASKRDLKAMEQPGWEYPGDAAILQEMKRKKPKSRTIKLLFRTGLAAAIVAALGIGSVAAYQYWHMPAEGTPYTGDVVQVHETQTYTLGDLETLPGETEVGTSASIAERLSDEWFIEQAVEVLTTVNKMPVDAKELTVTRQKDQRWDREEVMVSLGDADATFDAVDGVLIHVTAFDEPYSEGEGLSEAEALALAQEYYDSLPYARGYEFVDVTKFDTDMWMYSFSKSHDIEGQTVYSSYEQVRITINPLNGHFQMSNCFYVPLLAEHDPNQAALTVEQARRIVESSTGFNKNWLNYDCTAQLTIALPRPECIPAGAEPVGDGPEDETIVHGQLSGFVNYAITRPAWQFCYDGEYIPEGMDEGFADGGTIAVDLYTGEILCQDFYG